MLLITGGSGKLGAALQTVFPHAVFPSRNDLDLLRPETIETFISTHTPSAVLHTAAYTNVRTAEQEHHLCWETNVRGTELLVEALLRRNPQCYFVYVSTACVFYGDRGSYAEDDIPNPKNFYGLTKLLGEYVARRFPLHLIIRTNFAPRAPWPYPKAFIDRFGTYLYADDVARAIKDVLAKQLTGVAHIAGDRKLSMLELARMISPAVEPMSMREVTLPLTVDMTLTSKRIARYRLTEDGDSAQVATDAVGGAAPGAG